MKYNLYIHNKTKCIYNVLFIKTHSELVKKIKKYCEENNLIFE